MNAPLDSRGPVGFNVRNFGAIGDGQILDTQAIQATIEACHNLGGGTVWFPAGQYVTGSIFLRSNISLHLEAGAVLLGSEAPVDYPVIKSRWEGREQSVHASLIGGEGLQDIAIVGRGTIDGRGAGWWQRQREKTLDYPRPRLISFTGCRNLLIENITVTHSPSWTINPVRCENVTINNVTVINPPDSPNTDGINPDSCRNVRISNCYVSVGDDCITLKSGSEADHLEHRMPCSEIAITNCTLAAGHGGVVIGSEMSGDVRNVVISNCVFTGTDRGLRFKSRRGRGGMVENVRVTNVVMTDVLCPLTMNLYYAPGAWGDPTVSDKGPHPVTAGTPHVRGIHISHLTATGVKTAAAFLFGLAEMPVEDVSLSDVSISMDPKAKPGYADMADDIELMQRTGFYIRNTRWLRLRNVEVRGQSGPAIRLIDSSHAEIGALSTRPFALDAPIIQLTNVDTAYIHNCCAPPEAKVFLSIEGGTSRAITLQSNHLIEVKYPVTLSPGVSPNAVLGDERAQRLEQGV